ncbi:hypothetical protein M433DRAFT_386533 [Acidomyces richmondensis BFW]|nr:MAG: hypothetical protein FE78DRAFT_200300 [Acidomyces sp. 'richmondensis']KYG48786.1 hypothetical protein M433DRAFT_386533 [Acidomyces richmondensis BFW]
MIIVHLTSIWCSSRFFCFLQYFLSIESSSVWYGSAVSKTLQRKMDLGLDIIDDIIAPEFETSNTNVRTLLTTGRMLFTLEPANLQAMLATQFKDYCTGHQRFQQFKPILGRSIFSSDGPFWEHSRALFRPQFSRDNINDLEATGKAADALIRALGSIDFSGWTEEVDMQPLLFNLTLDTASDFLFGESINSQDAAMKLRRRQYVATGDVEDAALQATKFTDDFALVTDTILTRVRLQSLYFLGDGIKFRKAVANTRRFVEHWVQLALGATKTDKVQGHKDTLLHRLATQTKDAQELRDQTLAILFAGRDTTASLLGWCFARLSLHPDYFLKLRSIVVKDFAPGEPITFAKLKSCRELQHFLNEVLRLHPTVPLNYRIAAHDTTLPVGGGADQRSPVAVRKGEPVFYSVYLMHRRKDLWGEDAMEFKPERFEQRIPAWQFLPFNGGPRICLGQQFALTEASFVLVRVLQQFDAIEPANRAQMQKLRKEQGITMWPADGVKVRLHRAAI